MRVHNPVASPSFCWPRTRAGRRIRSSVCWRGATKEVELTKQIPVHVTYFTAVVGDDGQVKYFGDIYGHDRRFSAALAGRYVAPEVVAEAAPDAPAKGKKGKKRPPVTDNLW